MVCPEDCEVLEMGHVCELAEMGCGESRGFAAKELAAEKACSSSGTKSKDYEIGGEL